MGGARGADRANARSRLRSNPRGHGCQESECAPGQSSGHSPRAPEPPGLGGATTVQRLSQRRGVGRSRRTQCACEDLAPSPPIVAFLTADFGNAAHPAVRNPPQRGRPCPSGPRTGDGIVVLWGAELGGGAGPTSASGERLRPPPSRRNGILRCGLGSALASAHVSCRRQGDDKLLPPSPHRGARCPPAVILRSEATKCAGVPRRWGLKVRATSLCATMTDGGGRLVTLRVSQDPPRRRRGAGSRGPSSPRLRRASGLVPRGAHRRSRRSSRPW